MAQDAVARPVGRLLSSEPSTSATRKSCAVMISDLPGHNLVLPLPGVLVHRETTILSLQIWREAFGFPSNYFPGTEDEAVAAAVVEQAAAGA